MGFPTRPPMDGFELGRVAAQGRELMSKPGESSHAKHCTARRPPPLLPFRPSWGRSRLQRAPVLCGTDRTASNGRWIDALRIVESTTLIDNPTTSSTRPASYW